MIVLVDLLEQLQSVEVIAFNGFLEDVDKVDLDWEAGPLRLLKQPDHVINIVNNASGDNVRLIKYLRELHS